MRRRQFVFSAATFALMSGCGVLPILGRPATRGMWRVGILNGNDANSASSNDQIAGLKQGLAELGYVDGQTIAFELRDADFNLARLPDLANELIQLPVDVLVSFPSPAVVAAHQATTVVPIVFVGVTDPVGKGWVASLAHPGGNLTGVSQAPPTTLGKMIEYLAQLVPQLSRIALFASLSPADPSLGPTAVQLTTTAANALGVQLKFLDVRTPDDVEPALAEALAWQTEAMMSVGGVAISNAIPRFMDFQLQNRIPFVTSLKEWVQAGGLLSYGPSVNGLGRQAAHSVDKILKGAKPAELPVEEPDRYELSVNQTTAQALGITIPPEVAQQVTEWVE
jgi:putative tryptophan/tyrosine transport system substrate-binding protein